MNRHLCLVVALLIPSLMVIPKPISQAGGLPIWRMLSVQELQSHDNRAIEVEAFDNLDAKMIDGQMQVTWSVNTPLDVAYFTIEKSDISHSFAFIGGIRVKLSPNQSYRFVDLLNPITPSTKYRIKMVLADGNVIYSRSIKPNFGSQIPDEIEHVKQILTLSESPQSISPFTIQIFDQQDQLFQSFTYIKVDENTTMLDLSDLPKGQYIIRLIDGHRIWHKRIEKD